MQCPIELGPSTRPQCGCKGRQGRWLLLQPEALYLGEITEQERKVHMPVGLSGRPRIVDGECPASGDRPLPPRAVPTGAAGFEVAAEAEVGLADLSAALNENMKDKGFVRDRAAPVVVESARMVGYLLQEGEPRMVIRLGLGGSVSSVIYLHGRLRYNDKTGLARLTDLAYTAETEDQFFKAAPALNHPMFRKRLSQFARFDLGAELAKAGERLQGMIARRAMTGFYLEASLDSLEPLEYRVTEKALLVRVAARGALEAGVRLGPNRNR
jgi:hypothetical protein